MPYRSHDANPVSQLVELKSLVQEGDVQAESARPLAVSLGIFREEVEVDKLTISVAIKKASLSLDLEGLEIVEKSKRGIDLAPSVISTKTATESTVQTSLETTVEFEKQQKITRGCLQNSGLFSRNRMG